MAVGIASATIWTLEDLFEEFGPIPANRIRGDPPPGMATEQDVIAIHDRENRLCELVDGVLVEKTMGYYESRLAALLIHILGTYLDQNDLGIVAGADGMIRLGAGLVRIPDVSFVSWEKLPKRKVPRKPIPDLVPDLAVEVLSTGNTKKEMERKLREYLKVGVLLVWFVDPKKQTVTVFTPPKKKKVLGPSQSLDGGSVLPGFTLGIAEFFAQVDQGGETGKR
jgi:Uma2 family endonuclease